MAVGRKRWLGEQNLSVVAGVPWNTSEDDANADGESPEVIRLERKDVPSHTKETYEDEPVPRRIKIRQEDLDEHGYTSGCNGRKAKMHNREARPRSDACRQRI